MVLLKDLKSILYEKETVNVYDENCKLANIIPFHGNAMDIPQEFDDCIVYEVFINACEELSIYIKKV